MRFKDVFSIIGPAMVGPSSSHTAGAARIGRAARQLFGEQPEQALILFYGSFAATYRGHGTDRAIVGGLLDLQTDDPRIPDALEIAEQRGLHVTFDEGKGLFPHPNTAKIVLASSSKPKQLSMVGTSIGGGNIEIVEINGFSVKMSGVYPTLVLWHHDWPGAVADMTQLLKQRSVNIGYMSVDRKSRSGDALTVLELDAAPTPELVADLNGVQAIQSVHIVDLNRESGIVGDSTAAKQKLSREDDRT
ncbi:L-serine ammonia-lyase, iron-sulfur-dependent, subunit beta [Paenibacillus sp. H1-7]|uniref:L-serine ammonia-lyase, iron-sulfur-dependent subunit beta n=1 Tax=Paenibacillus sp. H1-7 TaxID=2282849 RepID=UPI001EF95D03|nr:L-serine ammonia-lyase, iron-sulfur-dependent subunit beta [Paenibacillus sp. H1-7]ULL18613.1 L-serine ammonia-lyase, iron-sulfur-dependent, subunit beta [Paenibacillus sp. H1-7]